MRLSVGAGACCGAAALLGGARAALAAGAPAQPVTACDERLKQGQGVLRRMMRQLDATFPKDVRDRFMASCGKACFESRHGPRPAGSPDPEQVKRFLEEIVKDAGAENVRHTGDTTVVVIEYGANPRGLKTADHYCLCPIMEDAPADISPTYCDCTVGFLTELFERNLGRPARVEILESVLRGGKTCKLRVGFARV